MATKNTITHQVKSVNEGANLRPRSGVCSFFITGDNTPSPRVCPMRHLGNALSPKVVRGFADTRWANWEISLGRRSLRCLMG